MRKDYMTIYRENIDDYRDIYEALNDATMNLIIDIEDDEAINDDEFSSIENALFEASFHAESIIDDYIYIANNGKGWRRENAINEIEFALAQWGELYDTYIDFDN